MPESVEQGIHRQKSMGRSVTRIATYYDLTREEVRKVLAQPETPSPPEDPRVSRAFLVLRARGLSLMEAARMTDEELLALHNVGAKTLEGIRLVAPSIKELSFPDGMV